MNQIAHPAPVLPTRALPAAANAACGPMSREVVCVLGVPLDVIDTAAAVERLRDDAFAGRRCFLSTPNLNFAVAAARDEAFRRSLLRSDLCVADGMPLLWTARLMGVPLPERVSGADVFERMRRHAGPPVKVFFFGGPPGAAERAFGQLRNATSGVVCAGFDPAGFGSVEQMSEPQVLERINASGAQFVVVSLGAAKGQAWIERNRARLEAPLVSHLGAVVNFVAGDVSRAPAWVGRIGMEWLWRIKEQPELWRRYWRDGQAFVRWTFSCVLPLAARIAWRSLRRSPAVPPAWDATHAGDRLAISLRGDWTRDALAPLRGLLAEAVASGRSVSIDLRGVSWVDPWFVGLMLLASEAVRGPSGLQIVRASAAVVRVFGGCGARRLLDSSAAS